MNNVKKLYRNYNADIYCSIEEDKARKVEYVCEINLRKGTIRDFEFEQRNDHYVDWFDSIPTTNEWWNKAVETIMKHKML